MKPFSALNYLKKNKNRTIIATLMIFISMSIIVIGNYVASVVGTFEKDATYSDNLVVINMQTTDENYKDFKSVLSDVKKDKNLSYVTSSPRGFSSLKRNTLLNITVGDASYAFKNRYDMKKVFDHLGIEADLSDVKNGSIVISENLAKLKGIKKGDVIDKSLDDNLEEEHSVDAIIKDDCYFAFYVYDNGDTGRIFVYSEKYEGKELYDYVANLVGDRDVLISSSIRESIKRNFNVFYYIFYGVVILVAIVLAITTGSVLTGHYLKRRYEFGIYNALGLGKKAIKKKVAGEILIMDGIAFIAGCVCVLMFTFLANELVYKQQGMYLGYISKTGILGFILCNALIVLPNIYFKGRKMSRVDVTQF